MLRPKADLPAKHGRGSISLCMIVRDEESRLETCLESSADLADEIIVVDTGSTDRTKEIAASFGARVVDFVWIDDFGAARNESIRHASGDWIFWLDADDRIDEINRRRLLELFQNLPDEIAAFFMGYSCVVNAMTSKKMRVDQVRLFPNHPNVRWTHRVHEQILPAVLKIGGYGQQTDIVIDHIGYQDGPTRHRKNERNLRLLEFEIEEYPNRPFTLFNLGWTLLMLNRPKDAEVYLESALEQSTESNSHFCKLYTILSTLHRTQGRFGKAMQFCQRGRLAFPDDPELLFTEGLLHHQMGDLRKAAECLERLVTIEPYRQLTFGVDEGLTGYLARHNLAIVYRDQGRLRDAEAEWRKALAERPDMRVALLGLGEIILAQKRWRDLEGICCSLEKCQHGTIDGAVLRARAHFGRSEFKEARQILEPIVAAIPALSVAKKVLGQVLLKEGKDLATAELILQEVLRLEPKNKAVARELAKLAIKRKTSKSII